MVRIASVFSVLSIFAVSVLALTPGSAGSKNVGNGKGLQFTTAGCTSDADCQQGCCAGGATSSTGLACGICSGIGADFQNGKTGCGFVDPNAAQNIADAQAVSLKQGF